MALVGDGEGEQRGVRLQPLRHRVGQVGQEQVVVEGGGRAVHRAVVVLREAVLVEAQVAVDVLAVVEPVVAGVPAKGLIALVLQIPHIGRGVGAVVGIFEAHSGEEGPLGVHRAPGEDVGQQVPGIALRLQGVVPGVHVLGELDPLKGGEVGESLQHHRHHVHLLVLRDVLVLVLGQQDLRLLLVVALRRVGQGILHAVQEGVQQAPGHILLGGGPLVNVRRVGVLAVHAVAGVHRDQRGGAHCRGGGQSRPDAAPGPAPGKQGQHRDAPSGAQQGQRRLVGEKQLVLPRHLPRLPQDQQVGGDHRIVPEGQLVVVPQGPARWRRTAGPPAAAGAAGSAAAGQGGRCSPAGGPARCTAPWPAAGRPAPAPRRPR